MEIVNLHLRNLKLIKPHVFSDSRGYFFEVFNQNKFVQHDMKFSIVQINQSGSRKGVLRGLHYQVKKPQGKLVRVITGEIFDVAVDLRESSDTYGQWEGVFLKAEDKTQLWVPPGFAHGFLVLSTWADVEYGTTDFYSPENERTIVWDDKTLAIKWPLVNGGLPLLAEKDAKGVSFDEAEKFNEEI